jgi:transcription elongation factor Elf1
MKLNKGEMICPVCNGTGKIILTKEDRKSKVILICKLCGGEKKIDCIENILWIPKQIEKYISIDNKTGKDIYIEDANLMKFNYFMSEYSEKFDKLFKDNGLDIVEVRV